METNPDKKIAVISGGTGYLGSAVAKRLAENGMLVALLDRNTPQGKEAKNIIESLSGSSHKIYNCDLNDKTAVENTINLIEKEMGEIFAVIHTAGVKPLRKTILNTTQEELEEALRVNVVSGFNFLSVGAEKLKLHGRGVLVGITTLGVAIPEATKSLGGYIPAKYALQGILTMLNEELRDSNVRVYSVAPGFMEGGMNSDIPKAFIEMIRMKNKDRKLTTAEDVALKISYLCSENSKTDTRLTHIVATEYVDK